MTEYIMYDRGNGFAADGDEVVLRSRTVAAERSDGSSARRPSRPTDRATETTSTASSPQRAGNGRRTRSGMISTVYGRTRSGIKKIKQGEFNNEKISVIFRV